jgi:anti-anti-sigma factor
VRKGLLIIMPLTGRAGESLDVRVITSGEATRIQLSGELDISCASDLAKSVEEFLARDPRPEGPVTVELEGLQFADISGLRTIAASCERLRFWGYPVRVRHVRGELRRVIDLTGIRLPTG